MKINYFGKPVDDWKPSYPYLARGKRTGALAVVFSPTKTILIESVSLHGVGYFAGDDKWSEHHFIPLTPSERVMLENE